MIEICEYCLKDINAQNAHPLYKNACYECGDMLVRSEIIEERTDYFFRAIKTRRCPLCNTPVKFTK